jgi:hypothetical protein
LYDHIEKRIGERFGIIETMWKRREFENYLKVPEVLYRWAEQRYNPDMALFQPVKDAMRTAVEKTIAPMHLEDPADPWWHDEKMSDNILAPVFSRYYKELGLPVAMNKGDYYQLVSCMRPEEVDQEIKVKLDSLAEFLRNNQVQ